jgi:hypothetical protein
MTTIRHFLLIPATIFAFALAAGAQDSTTLQLQPLPATTEAAPEASEFEAAIPAPSPVLAAALEVPAGLPAPAASSASSGVLPFIAPGRIAPSPRPTYVPSYLIREDKVQRFLKETLSPEAFLTSALSGAFNQASDFSGAWGDGGEAYGGRVASSIGQGVLKNSMRFGLDMALGMNSHYRRSGSDTFWGRLGHALTSSVMAYKDDGSRTIGIPRIASTYGSAFAVNMWYPNTRNSTQDALIRGTTSLGITAGKNVLKEFWPDIKRAFKR